MTTVNANVCRKRVNMGRRQVARNQLTPACCLVCCDSGLRLDLTAKDGEIDERDSSQRGREKYFFFHWRLPSARERLNVYLTQICQSVAAIILKGS